MPKWVEFQCKSNRLVVRADSIAAYSEVGYELTDIYVPQIEHRLEVTERFHEVDAKIREATKPEPIGMCVGRVAEPPSGMHEAAIKYADIVDD